MIAIITIIIIFTVVILALPTLVQAAVGISNQVYYLYENSEQTRKHAEKTFEDTLEITTAWCSSYYDMLFEDLIEQLDNPGVKMSKTIYDKVGYLDECRTGKLISLIDDNKKKKFDRMEIMCNLSSCTKTIYEEFKEN